MTNDMFEKWDVVIEVDSTFGHKFVVIEVLDGSYIFQDMKNPGSREGYSKEFAWHLFVKVGRWDCKAGREIEDEM